MRTMFFCIRVIVSLFLWLFIAAFLLGSLAAREFDGTMAIELFEGGFGSPFSGSAAIGIPSLGMASLLAEFEDDDYPTDYELHELTK